MMAEIPLVSFHENLGLLVVANEQFDPAKKPFLVETHLPTRGCQGLESNIWKQDATKGFLDFSRAFGAYNCINGLGPGLSGWDSNGMCYAAMARGVPDPTNSHDVWCVNIINIA